MSRATLIKVIFGLASAFALGFWIYFMVDCEVRITWRGEPHRQKRWQRCVYQVYSCTECGLTPNADIDCWPSTCRLYGQRQAAIEVTPYEYLLSWWPDDVRKGTEERFVQWVTECRLP